MHAPLIVGNWKLHKTVAESVTLAKSLTKSDLGSASVGIAPVFTSLAAVADITADSSVLCFAQNCHFAASGAYTGEIAPAMLRDVGCDGVILGHSERRTLFHESDELIAKKISAALAAGLKVIACIGETLAQREAAQVDAVLSKQMAAIAPLLTDNAEIAIAYEPVWAIGTGKTATPEIAQAAHKTIRGLLADAVGADHAKRIPIQYGGSVKPNNTAALLAQPDIDGALVGGASLEFESFNSIVTNAQIAE